jgi:hypothetical protein
MNLKKEVFGCDELARFEFLAAMNIKITVTCDLMPSNLVDIYEYFGETYCLHFPGTGSFIMKIEIAGLSETC